MELGTVVPTLSPLPWMRSKAVHHSDCLPLALCFGASGCINLQALDGDGAQTCVSRSRCRSGVPLAAPAALEGSVVILEGVTLVLIDKEGGLPEALLSFP